ncbi:MAG: 16S rRNA (cytosine(1402)-N(4))-methyltransferase RsmH [Candidatus Pacebacteria bacterium]|nr:16S rRNA (cytosine(1402)-N(4))-methyltransferase RsmH [Candidatus Paceibacterota bacterium]
MTKLAQEVDDKTQSTNPTKLHQPVLLEQAIAGLKIRPDLTYIDATFGRGGHTQALLNRGVDLIAFDFDQQAIIYGQQVFEQEITTGQLILINQNFNQLKTEIEKLRQDGKLDKPIGGILFDFGTTQDQLKSKDRGFSFDIADSQLDMRMDQNLGLKASDLLNVLSVKQLIQLFTQFGGESPGLAKRIARLIDRYRGPNRENRIETAGQLVDIVKKVKTRRSRLHPATKIFQALRIAVNDELGNIEQALPQGLELLTQTGRLVTIAFHEGEDRLAKHQLKNWQQQGQGQVLTDKPIRPDEDETDLNPAARSAKLRIFEKK